MKPTTVLFASMLCLPAMAQRDFRLTVQRNPWLTAGNAAALTTYADSTLSQADVHYEHLGGSLRSASEPRHASSFGGNVESYFRVSPTVVAHGSMTYSNIMGTQMSGSMLWPTTSLKPFDLVDDSTGNAGNKRMETFHLTGAVGWQATSHVAFGAAVDFTAGTYAKHRDLRHTNTLMRLHTVLSTFWSPNASADGIGASVLYRRTTETLLFDVYGKTDRVFKTLVDYANHHGEVETYGVQGFTDDSREMPLLSQHVGFGLQGSWHGLFAEATYLHRTGRYGKHSQYTAAHEQHRGDLFTLHLRADAARTSEHLWWTEAMLNTERLMAQRENYRRVAATDNSSLNYYEYYEPTKMSDKAQTYGSLSATGYWQPAGAIYLWHIHGGAAYHWCKQTAYLYPETYTTRTFIVTPFVEVTRTFTLPHATLISATLSGSVTTIDLHQTAMHAAVRYEWPISHTRVRPSVGLGYNFRTATAGTQQGLTRTAIAVSVGATF